MQLCDSPIASREIQAIVFDFDNVIVRGSEACKDSAWDVVFTPGTPEHTKLREAQQMYPKGFADRYAFLAHVYDVPADANPRLDSRVLFAVKTYNQFVQKSILNIGIEKSDLEALFFLKGKFPLYIISATPEEALHETLANLGLLYQVELQKMFSLALGRPSSKPKNFLKVYEHSGIPFNNILMVGDGKNDYAAASEVGSWFVGVTTNENKMTWEDATFIKITAIDELPKALGISQH